MIPFNIYLAIVAWSWQVCASVPTAIPDPRCIEFMNTCQTTEWLKRDGRDLGFIQEVCSESLPWEY